MQSGLSQLIASSEPGNLTYSIAGSTPHSGKYGPENIVFDNPADHTSRWSSAYQGATHQWILLCLDSLSILQWIKFGKYSKSHPCNMKEFKVFVGTSEDHMIEVLHSGLRNDTIPEHFPLRHVNRANVAFPTRFVKIVPLSAHQSNYHTSVWHVSLQGIKNPDVVERVRRAHEEYREAVVLRHVLKHLRQRRLLTPFDSILSRSFMRLEHPLVTQLYSNIILHGNWSQAEQLLDKLSSAGLFDSYLQSCRPYTTFNQLHGTDADGDVPLPRGGHAMCIDSVNDQIYIHGGYDGDKSLDDFWMYDVKKNKWKVLSLGTAQEQNAPGPRSCHKMVFDTKTGSIYLLGRLSDQDQDQLKPSAPAVPSTAPPDNTASAAAIAVLPAATPLQQVRQLRAIATTSLVPPPAPVVIGTSRSSDNYCSEFFRYHTRGADAGKWDFLSFDTASTGGPPLVFDHQMALDSDSQMLYVFGGRIVDGDKENTKCGGMYCYNVRKSKWSTLMQPNGNVGQGIPPRSGHSMLLDPNTKTLYIYAGRRKDIFLSDMYSFDLKTCTATEIFSESPMMGGPDPSFSQRAVIDPDLKEIYVISGLTRKLADQRSPLSLQCEMTHWVYRYDTQPGKWSKVLLEPPSGCSSGSSNSPTQGSSNHPSSPDADAVPRPRYAYQVVYNPRTKAVFIHGGNAGKTDSARMGAGPSPPPPAERTNSDEGSGPPESEAEKENQPETDQRSSEETRLNDLWKFKLHRPGPERILRRAKFVIRSQQYREMSEEQTPFKALRFLQNDVAEVVDHSDRTESDEFRSLMKYLLVPSANIGLSSRTSSASTVRAGPTANPNRPASEAESAHRYPIDYLQPSEGSKPLGRRGRTFDLYRVDEGEDGEEDEDDEDDDKGSDEETGGAWTNDISQFRQEGCDKDDSECSNQGDARRTLVVNPDALLDVPDPTEFRGRHSKGETSGSASKNEIPSGLRYQQRMEVYEALLEYVAEEDKQPSGSLLDLVGDGDGGGTLTGGGIARSRFTR